MLRSLHRWRRWWFSRRARPIPPAAAADSPVAPPGPARVAGAPEGSAVPSPIAPPSPARPEVRAVPSPVAPVVVAAPPPPRSLPHRVAVAVAWIAAIAAAILNLRQGWIATWSPAGIPNFDIADYMLRAHQMADSIDAGDASAWFVQAVAPDVHPPMHPAITSLWLATFGRSMDGACVLAFIEYTAAVALLIPIGRAVDRHTGGFAGLVAAVLTTMSLLHRDLSTAPMTEPMSLLFVNIALMATLLGEHRATAPGRAGGALFVGFTVLAAGLVRYNLIPMLLVPLAAVHAVRVLSQQTRWLDPSPLLWFLPSIVTLAAWQHFQPDLQHAIVRFFANVDSEIPLWSEENLTWLPNAFTSGITGSPVLSALTAGGFAVGIGHAALRLRRGESTREILIQTFVVVAAVALFVHRYKLGRNLYVVAPLAYLAAALPICRLGSRSLAIGGLLLALSTGGWWELRALTDPHVKQNNFLEQPELERMLKHIASVASGSQRLVVAGAHRELNAHILELQLRSTSPNTEVIFQPPYPPSCETDEARPEQCSPGVVQTWAHEPGTAFMTVAQTRSLGRKGKRTSNRRQWTAKMAEQVNEILTDVPGLTKTTETMSHAGLEVTIWEGGE